MADAAMTDPDTPGDWSFADPLCFLAQCDAIFGEAATTAMVHALFLLLEQRGRVSGSTSQILTEKQAGGGNGGH